MATYQHIYHMTKQESLKMVQAPSIVLQKIDMERIVNIIK